jgi:hypothetical protein
LLIPCPKGHVGSKCCLLFVVEERKAARDSHSPRYFYFSMPRCSMLQRICCRLQCFQLCSPCPVLVNSFLTSYLTFLLSLDLMYHCCALVKSLFPCKKSNSTGVNNAGKEISDKQLGLAVNNGTYLTNSLAVEIVRYYYHLSWTWNHCRFFCSKPFCYCSVDFCQYLMGFFHGQILV